ncbi:MAG: DUF2752 domain-containing protein [Deltaproteobacteria bacterium]|nr:DUF2752 domain-containing protein [Deltaproteobacteria bacterium]
MKSISFVPLSRDKVIIRWAGVVLIFALLIAARLYNPFESELMTCRFKDLTGYDCPTCGMSRSVYSILSLDIVDSVSYHPLGGLLILGLFAVLVRSAAELITGKEFIIPVKKSFRRFVMLFILFLLFATWIFKLCMSL